MTAIRPVGRPVRFSLFRQVLAGQHDPETAANRYVTLARARAGRADPGVFAASAREDVCRLAAALHGVLTLHRPDGRSRCPTCSIGPYLVDWPCLTRRAPLGDGIREHRRAVRPEERTAGAEQSGTEDRLRHGWPVPTELAQLADVADLAGPDGRDEPPGPYEGFALAVLACHDVLPPAGGQPARCRTCRIPPGECPVWALAEGFLGHRRCGDERPSQRGRRRRGASASTDACTDSGASTHAGASTHVGTGADADADAVPGDALHPAFDLLHIQSRSKGRPEDFPPRQ